MKQYRWCIVIILACLFHTALSTSIADQQTKVKDACLRTKECGISGLRTSHVTLMFLTYSALKTFSRDQTKSLEWEDTETGMRRPLYAQLTLVMRIVKVHPLNSKSQQFQTITTGCDPLAGARDNVVCFDEDLDTNLSFVTELQLYHTADVDFSILNLFTGLRKFATDFKGSGETNVDLVSLNNLVELKLGFVTGVTYSCPFECILEHELDRFEIDFKHQDFGKRMPSISNKLTFSKKIKTAKFSSEKGMLKEKLDLTGVVIDEVIFDQFNHNWDFPFALVGSRIKSISIVSQRDRKYSVTWSNAVFLSLCKQGLQFSVTFDNVKPEKEDKKDTPSNQIPFPVSKAIFESVDENKFEYALRMLRSQSDNSFTIRKGVNERQVFVIRAIKMTLSKVKDHYDMYIVPRPGPSGRFIGPNYDEVRIYVKNLIIDTDINLQYDLLNLLSDKRMIVHYLHMGTEKSNLIKTMYLPMTKTKSDQSSIRYQDLAFQLIDMRHTHMADSIFLQFLAMMLTMHIRPSPMEQTSVFEDPKLQKMAEVLTNNMENMDSSMYSPYTISRALIPINFITEYISHDVDRKLRKIPYLSMTTLRENIHILIQAGKDLQEKKSQIALLRSTDDIKNLQRGQLQQVLQKISDSKLAILQASKDKSTTLAELELQHQDDLNKRFQSNIAFLEKLKVKFDKFEVLVKKETANFKQGVQIATSIAIAEAAVSVINSIFGIFSGKFDPTKALKLAKKIKKLKDVIYKIMNVMKKLAKLISKGKMLKSIGKKMQLVRKNALPKIKTFFTKQKAILKELFAKDAGPILKNQRIVKYVQGIKEVGRYMKYTQTNIENTINVMRATDIGWDIGNLKIPKDKLTTHKKTLDTFRNRHAEDVVETSKGYNKIDVFNWKIAKEHVIGMIDTTLSNDIPEATAYRTALLKLITTGETRTQASVDQNELQVAIAFSEKAWFKYFNEAVAIGLEIEKSRDELNIEQTRSIRLTRLRELTMKKRAKINEEIEWETFVLKLAFIRSNQEYCDAYYYFHLEHCKLELFIHPTQDLEKILTLQNMLFFESNQKLLDLYPPPQTFTDLMINLTDPNHCQCLEDFRNFKKGITDKHARIAALKKTYDTTKTCLEDKGVQYPNDQKEHDFTNKVMQRCMENPVETMKSEGVLMYKVDVDSLQFFKYERGRVDDIKVELKGAKSQSGVVEVSAESTGIYEDRYKGSCFKFVGSKWERALSYRHTDKRSRLTNDSTIRHRLISRNGTAKRENIAVINSGQVHKSFSGVFTAPTLFTTWVFRLDNNEEVDLSKLNEIHLMFSGSFVSGSGQPKYTCNKEEEEPDKRFYIPRVTAHKKSDSSRKSNEMNASALESSDDTNTSGTGWYKTLK